MIRNGFAGRGSGNNVRQNNQIPHLDNFDWKSVELKPFKKDFSSSIPEFNKQLSVN